MEEEYNYPYLNTSISLRLNGPAVLVSLMGPPCGKFIVGKIKTYFTNVTETKNSNTNADQHQTQRVEQRGPLPSWTSMEEEYNYHFLNTSISLILNGPAVLVSLMGPPCGKFIVGKSKTYCTKLRQH